MVIIYFAVLNMHMHLNMDAHMISSMKAYIPFLKGADEAFL